MGSTGNADASGLGLDGSGGFSRSIGGISGIGISGNGNGSGGKGEPMHISQLLCPHCVTEVLHAVQLVKSRTDEKTAQHMHRAIPWGGPASAFGLESAGGGVGVFLMTQ